MSTSRVQAPRLLLGVTSLDLPARTARDRSLEVANRFQESESLAVALVKALEAGAEAVYTVPSPSLRAAMSELRRPVPVLARLPHLPLVDDLRHEHPLLIETHDDPGDAWGGVRAGLAAMSMLPAALQGDLAVRVAQRLEREAAMLGAREVVGVAIASEITDLALAAGHARFFERLTRFGRTRFGGVVGFETRDLAHLVRRLHEWGVEPDFLIASVNLAGVGMTPIPFEVEAALSRPGIPVIAAELRGGGVHALEPGARYALQHGAHGLLPDLVDLDDVGGELRGLARMLGERGATAESD